ncbi:MAG: GAF domain-containing protein [Acidobacteriota bacterium]
MPTRTHGHLPIIGQPCHTVDVDQDVRYEALIRVGEAIRAGGNQDLFGLLADELRQIVPFHTMGVFDATKQKIEWRVHGSIPDADPIRGLPSKDTVVWSAYTNQQTVVIPSVEKETRFPVAVGKLKELGIGSICALPLTTAHRRLGGLVFASSEENTFPAEEVRFLSIVAGQVALAMDDAMNFRQAQRTAERLELLLELTNRAVSQLDLRDLLREVCSSIRRVMQCEGAGVALPDPESGRLRVYAIDFPASKGVIPEGLEYGDETSIVGSYRTGRTVMVDEQTIASQSLSQLAGTKSLCHIPIVGTSPDTGRRQRRQLQGERVLRRRHCVSGPRHQPDRDRHRERVGVWRNCGAEGQTRARKDLPRRRDSHRTELRRNRGNQRGPAASVAAD